MSELRIDTWTMPAADLGAENPLPPLESAQELHQVTDVTGLPDDMVTNMRYGHVPNILPYTLQDGYSRERRPKEFKAAVLENAILRATFLLDYGGRLWSLYHKPSGRELLRVNPVFQPANLALRNAWFSGGVEWNIGTIGHSPTTCSPIFAARVAGDNGTPVLRMYEWERLRQVAFQVDAYLPDGSPVLLVQVRIVNPHDRAIPMYWWSNMAVPETPDTRVIVPARSAYSFAYGTGLKVLPVPEFDGVDRSYTTSSTRAMDYFFHIPDASTPWITAVDQAGKGLIQFSTRRLKGRKLFLWGVGSGGSRWQEFLSEPGYPYLEIQAGLARTQLEHVRMPAKADWSWLEGYGFLEADPAKTHGTDWEIAQQAVEDGLERLMSPDNLEAEFERCTGWADRAPLEIVHHGSGWGALERQRREKSGEAPFCSDGLVFEDETLDVAQQPWLELLESEKFPTSAPSIPPSGFMVQSEWWALLETALTREPENWLGWLHLGVLRWYAGSRDAARAAWEQSLKYARTAWALRNLAVLAQAEGELERAADLYLEAHELNPTLRVLTIEAGNVLLEAQRPEVCLDMIGQLSDTDRQHGRIRLLEGWAALILGDYERVERIFASQFVVDDLREGNTRLTELWFELHERRLSVAENIPLDADLQARVRRDFPLPTHYDFRMVDG